MDMRAFQSGDPRWMTYQQAQAKNWQVHKGEKSTTIFFSKPFEVEDDEAKDGKRTVRILKHYSVFHASQIDGVPAYKAPTFEEARWTRPESAEIILKNSGAVIRTGGERATASSQQNWASLRRSRSTPATLQTGLLRSKKTSARSSVQRPTRRGLSICSLNSIQIMPPKCRTCRQFPLPAHY